MATCEWPTYHPPMNILTVELPGELHATLTNEARRRNMTRSSLVREIIENALVVGTTNTTRSCTDLATDRCLQDEAVAQDAHRAVADNHR